MNYIYTFYKFSVFVILAVFFSAFGCNENSQNHAITFQPTEHLGITQNDDGRFFLPNGWEIKSLTVRILINDELKDSIQISPENFQYSLNIPVYENAKGTLIITGECIDPLYSEKKISFQDIELPRYESATNTVYVVGSQNFEITRSKRTLVLNDLYLFPASRIQGKIYWPKGYNVSTQHRLDLELIPLDIDIKEIFLNHEIEESAVLHAKLFYDNKKGVYQKNTITNDSFNDQWKFEFWVPYGSYRLDVLGYKDDSDADVVWSGNERNFETQKGLDYFLEVPLQKKEDLSHLTIENHNRTITIEGATYSDKKISTLTNIQVMLSNMAFSVSPESETCSKPLQKVFDVSKNTFSLIDDQFLRENFECKYFIIHAVVKNSNDNIAEGMSLIENPFFSGNSAAIILPQYLLIPSLLYTQSALGYRESNELITNESPVLTSALATDNIFSSRIRNDSGLFIIKFSDNKKPNFSSSNDPVDVIDLIINEISPSEIVTSTSVSNHARNILSLSNEITLNNEFVFVPHAVAASMLPEKEPFLQSILFLKDKENKMLSHTILPVLDRDFESDIYSLRLIPKQIDAEEKVSLINTLLFSPQRHIDAQIEILQQNLSGISKQFQKNDSFQSFYITKKGILKNWFVSADYLTGQMTADNIFSYKDFEPNDTLTYFIYNPKNPEIFGFKQIHVSIDTVNRAPEIIVDTESLKVTEKEKTHTLNASGSYDLDGDAITFQWKQISGDHAEITPIQSGASANVILPDIEIDSKEHEFWFQVTVTDDFEPPMSSSKDIHIIFKNENDAPIIYHNTEITVEDGETFIVNAEDYVEEPDGDSIQYEWSIPSVYEKYFDVKSNENSIIIVSVWPLKNNGDNAQPQFIETQMNLFVKDSLGSTTEKTFTVEIKNKNFAPIPFINESENNLYIENATLTFSAQSFDFDGDDIKYTWNLPPNITISYESPESKTITILTPNIIKNSDFEKMIITLNADDGNAVSQQEFSFLIKNKNQAPVLIPPSIPEKIIEKQLQSIPISVLDIDQDSLLFSSNPPIFTFKETIDGVIAEYQAPELPSNNIKQVSTIITIDDRHDGVITYPITLTIYNDNQNPEFDPESYPKEIFEGETISVDFKVFDRDYDTLSFSFQNNNDNNTALLFPIDNGVLFQFSGIMLDTNDAKKLNYTIITEDGFGGRAEFPISFIVKNINQAPYFDVSQQTQFTISEENALKFELLSYDPDSDTLEYDLHQKSDNTTNPFAMIQNGEFYFSPISIPHNPSESFFYEITIHDSVTAGEKFLMSDPLTIEIIVENKNQTPQFEPNQITAFILDEKTAIQELIPVFDPDNDMIQFSFHPVYPSDNLTNISDPVVTLSNDGIFSFTAPELPTNVQQVFKYKVMLDDGYQNGKAYKLFTFKVNNINVAPIANITGQNIVYENSQTTLSASGSVDSDNDTLTYTWKQTGGDEIAFEQSLADITFYTPSIPTNKTEDQKTYTFQLIVSDGFVNSEPKEFSVTVTNNNQAPTINAGDDIVSKEHSYVTLQSTAEDLDSDVLSYQWTQISGPSVLSGQYTSPYLQFTTPDISDQILTLEFKVGVNDNYEGISHDKVIVTVGTDSDGDTVPSIESGGIDCNDNNPSQTITCTVELQDTAVILCYNNEGPMTECPAENAYFFGQDAQYGRNSLLYDSDRFDSDNVIDHSTGLAWKKSIDNSKWSTTLCLTDQRLPNIHELISIIDFNSLSFIGSPFSTLTQSSSLLLLSSSAIGININYGNLQTGIVTSGVSHCVPLNIDSLLGTNNYELTSSLITTDLITQLEWQKSPQNKNNWRDALQYCADLTFDEKSDWRLPNIKELYSIANPLLSPAIDINYFITITQTGTYNIPNYKYYSSTTNINSPNKMFYVDFLNATIQSDSKDSDGFQAIVRCVRNIDPSKNEPSVPPPDEGDLSAGGDMPPPK